MTIYKIKNNKIFDIRNEEDSYILKDGKDYIERSSDVLYKNAFYDISLDEVIEKATQLEIDNKAALLLKQELVQSYIQDDSTVWIGKTPSGIDIAIIMGDDKKTKVVEII